MLRAAEVFLTRNRSAGSVYRMPDVSEQRYVRWCKGYGGLRKAKRFMEMEKDRDAKLYAN